MVLLMLLLRCDLLSLEKLRYLDDATDLASWIA